MRNPVFAFRSRPVFQAGVVILIAGMSASCSNSLRLQEPFFTGSTDNQKEIIGSNDTGGDDSYQPIPSRVANNSVSRSDLPPPPDYGQPSNDYAAAEPAYEDDVAPIEGSYGYSAVGGKVITVARNENLDMLTAKFGVPQEQILSANQLSSPAQVRPGKVLVIPRRVALSAEQMRSTRVAAYAPPAEEMEMTPRMNASGSTYVVQPGDTLFGVARRSGMKATEIADLNGIGTDTQLQTGQTLRLRGTAPKQMVAASQPRILGAPERPLGQLTVSKEPKIRLTSPAETAETGQMMAEAPQVPEMPAIPVERPNRENTKTVSANAIDDAADAASTDGKSFRWPVRGRIISGFGSKPNGEKNDGINLAVPEGTSVKSVEAGTVIYSGNELEGYGNLVLVRHADGWVSAYAHNKDILVKRGDQVRRGETLAHAGMSGSVSAPQVHFELRKGAKPVNPLDYLAGA